MYICVYRNLCINELLMLFNLHTHTHAPTRTHYLVMRVEERMMRCIRRCGGGATQIVANANATATATGCQLQLNAAWMVVVRVGWLVRMRMWK